MSAVADSWPRLVTFLAPSLLCTRSTRFLQIHLIHMSPSQGQRGRSFPTLAHTSRRFYSVSRAQGQHSSSASHRLGQKRQPIKSRGCKPSAVSGTPAPVADKLPQTPNPVTHLIRVEYGPSADCIANLNIFWMSDFVSGIPSFRFQLFLIGS